MDVLTDPPSANRRIEPATKPARELEVNRKRVSNTHVQVEFFESGSIFALAFFYRHQGRRLDARGGRLQRD